LKKSKWLAEQYTGIARIFAIIAHLICIHPPQQHKKLLLSAAIGKNQHTLIGGREDEEKMPSNQELIEILRDAYRRECTRLFFESIVFMKHNVASTKQQLTVEEEAQIFQSSSFGYCSFVG
jgi:hypothetical protein